MAIDTQRKRMKLTLGLAGMRWSGKIFMAVSGQMAIVLSFLRRASISVASPRETVTAVYSDARMPTIMVIEKPLSGPVPKANSAPPASSAVLVGSKVVPNADRTGGGEGRVGER